MLLNLEFFKESGVGEGGIVGQRGRREVGIDEGC